MNKKISISKRLIYIILPLILIAVVVIRLKKNKEETAQKVYHYDKNLPIIVQVDTLQLEYLSDGNFFSGTFEPYRETKISTEVQGKVNLVLVDLGSSVHKGQILVQLDHSLLQLQLQSLQVQLDGLEADVKRFTILNQADAVQGIQLEKTILGLKSAKVQQAILLEQIRKTTIKAPFDGFVTAKLIEEGAFAAPGVPLLQITDISTLKFTVNVPESDLSQFKLQEGYNVKPDAYADISLYGTATMIASKANIGNSFTIQFQVKNDQHTSIKSGMFGKVELKEKSPDKAIVIPSSVIIGETGQQQVYLLKAGKAVKQKIVVSKNFGDKSLVSVGLNAGDIIVTDGFINLFEGANIIVK